MSNDRPATSQPTLHEELQGRWVELHLGDSSATDHDAVAAYVPAAEAPDPDVVAEYVGPVPLTGSRPPVWGTARLLGAKQQGTPSDAEGVDETKGQSRPQKPPNAFPPLTTTEQVERRDAIKAKLMRKRAALSQSTA